jgi:hypothetical protein
MRQIRIPPCGETVCGWLTLVTEYDGNLYLSEGVLMIIDSRSARAGTSSVSTFGGAGTATLTGGAFASE